MEEAVIVAIKQMPALGILVMFVYWFLKHIKDDRIFMSELVKKYDETTQRASADYKELSKSLSVALGQALEVIKQATSELERMERRRNQ